MASVQDHQVSVPHLAPQILTVQLAQGDRVNIIVKFSCHCWTKRYDEALHRGQMRIMDHKHPRVFDPGRYADSLHLPTFVQGMMGHKCMLTASERNYMSFDATIAGAGSGVYRVYFDMRQDKGRWNGIRHKLQMYVESAYIKHDSEEGTATSFQNIVAAALQGKKIAPFHKPKP